MHLLCAHHIHQVYLSPTKTRPRSSPQKATSPYSTLVSVEGRLLSLSLSLSLLLFLFTSISLALFLPSSLLPSWSYISTIRALLLFSLFLVARALSFFGNQKKKVETFWSDCASPVRNRACWTTEAFGGSRNSYSRVLHSSLMSSTTLRRDTSMVVSFSQVGLAFHFFFLLFFRFFFFMFAAEMQHYSVVLQRKISFQCLEHTVSRTAWDCGEPEKFFFLAQIIFFHLAA